MSEVIKRFIDCYVPTEICNLKCSYCYLGQKEGFSGNIYKFKKTPNEYRQALSKKRFGGTMLLNFCAGGETLLDDSILDIIYELLLEGHYVQIVTNGTVNSSISRILTWKKDLLERLFIKFSFHYLEFIRLNLIDHFFNNVNRVKEKGISFTVEITPSDDLIPYIKDVKCLSLDRLGVLPHITIARDLNNSLEILSKLSFDEYKSTWGQFDSELFNVKAELYNKKITDYCYAGEWTLYLNLLSGDLRQCYKGEIIDNIFEDAKVPIKFKPIGCNCREPFCFNGHAWLTLGAVPSIDIPCYGEVRNRINSDGEEWLNTKIKQVFSTKLKSVNIEYERVDEQPKVLFIGNSFLKDYFGNIEELLRDKCYLYYNDEIVEGLTDLSEYLNKVAFDMSIGSNIDVVYVNEGIWDAFRVDSEENVVDEKEYGRNLDAFIWQLKYLFPNAKLLFEISTVAVEKDISLRKKSDINQYNKTVVDIMSNNNVEIVNLYEVIKNLKVGECTDNVDYMECMRKIIDVIVRTIEVIDKKKRLSKAIDNDDIMDIDIFNNRVILYGAGYNGNKYLRKLMDNGIKTTYIVDRNEMLENTYIDDVQIISPQTYRDSYFSEDDIMIISIMNESVWNYIISLFEGKPIKICSYKMIDVIMDEKGRLK